VRHIAKRFEYNKRYACTSHKISANIKAQKQSSQQGTQSPNTKGQLLTMHWNPHAQLFYNKQTPIQKPPSVWLFTGEAA
jgi:hypothetical protein